jgi:hypothetical protein
MHVEEARGYPRASKQTEEPRELTPALGRLTAADRDRPLRFGVDRCDLPNKPHADWPGMSGSTVLLQDGPDQEEIWVYGVVQAVPPNFDGQLSVARLADSWQEATFRGLLVTAGAPDKDAEDPTGRNQGQLNAILAAINAEKGVPLPVLREILGRLGDTDTPLDAASIEQRLRAKADEYGVLQERLLRLSNDDPRVLALRQKAARLISEGVFAAADNALSEAESRDLEAVEELETVAKRRRISAAESRADRAAAAGLRLDYLAAAAHYAEASAILPADDSTELAIRSRSGERTVRLRRRVR